MRIETGEDFGNRECPSCGLEVPANNNRCPVCGYDFPAVPTPRGGRSFFIAAAFGLVIAIILLSLFFAR